MQPNYEPVPVNLMTTSQQRQTVLAGDPDSEVVCMLSQLAPPDLFRVEQVTDTTELRELLRLPDVALAVMALELLRLDRQLVDRLEGRIRHGLPVVVTVGKHMPAAEIAARRLGCVLYAPKPLSFGLMSQALTGILCPPRLVGAG